MDNDFFGSYLERLDNLHKEMNAAVDGLPPEAMDWVPGHEMNSIAVLLAHTVGSLRFWIGDVALGEPSGRDREGEFNTRGLSGSEMQQRLETVFRYAQTALPRLQLSDLRESVTTPSGERTVSRAWALLHALEHAYLHLGHVQMTSQLWRERVKGSGR